MPIAPKSMKELESWADTTLWDEAISKEWDGLNDRDCFEHDLTLKDARQRHSKHNGDAKFKIVGMRMLLEAKIVDGKFNKAKARNVAQGHKGSLTKGVDYTTVFAAGAFAVLYGRICPCTNTVVRKKQSRRSHQRKWHNSSTR